MFRRLLCLLLITSLSCLVTAQNSLQGILAIDLGTESLKFSLVRHGLPFDILYNRESKRKTDSVVSWRGEDVFVGAEAATLSTRFPKDSLSSIKLLLGGDESLHSRVYPSNLVSRSQSDPASRGLRMQKSDSSFVYPEEALSQLFSYAKELAEETAHDTVEDTVIVVPPFFDYFQRQAVLTALKLAKLKPLAVINDGSAAAVNYAMSRNFNEKPVHHLFYDAGEGSVTSTIVSFTETPLSTKKTSSPTITTLDVQGTGFDNSVGGLEMTARLRNIIQNRFDQQYVTASGLDSVETSPRAMAKLLKESSRVKQVLSVNADANSKIESLYEDIDMSMLITRKEFEDACQDLKPHFVQPIRDSLSSANLTMDDISSVILIGGSSRVPLVRQALKDLVPDDKIAQNLNADEAAVMGAAFYGASKRPHFRTKSISLNDKSNHDITIDLDKSQNGILFPANAQLGSSKTLSISPRSNDFDIVFSSSDNDASDNLFKLHLSGLSEALNTLESKATKNKPSDQQSEQDKEQNEPSTSDSILINVDIDQSDFPSVRNVKLVRSIDSDNQDSNSEGGKGFIKGLFGSANSNNNDHKGQHQIVFDKGDDQVFVINGDQENESLNITASVELKFNIDYYPTSRPLSASEISEAKKRLNKQADAKKHKIAKSEALNSIESYLYRLRDRLGEDDHITEFKKFALEEELGILSNGIKDGIDWLSMEGHDASLDQLRTKKSELESLAKPIQTRIDDYNDRPFVIGEIDQTVTNTKAAIVAADDALKNSLAPEDEDDEDRQEGFREREELQKLKHVISQHIEWSDDVLTKETQEYIDPETTSKLGGLIINRQFSTAELRKQLKKLSSDLDRLQTWRKQWTARSTRLLRKASAKAKLKLEQEQKEREQQDQDGEPVAATSPDGPTTAQQNATVDHDAEFSKTTLPNDREPTQGHIPNHSSTPSPSTHDDHAHDEL